MHPLTCDAGDYTDCGTSHSTNQRVVVVEPVLLGERVLDVVLQHADRVHFEYDACE